MRFRQIEAFRATVSTGSVTQAAHLLGIGQPAVSRLIVDLETSTGFPLFHRRAGRVTPSAEGLRFHAAVERAFVSMEGLKRVADQIRHSYSGHLTISTIPVLSATIVPNTVRLFLESHPDVTLDIHTLKMTEIVESIQAQEADVAMSVSFTEVPGVRQEPLIDVKFVCALPTNHPLRRKKTIDIRDFDGQDFISLLPNTPIGWSRIDQLFDANGVRPRRRIATPQSQTAYSLVAAGVGIAILEPFGARHWSKNGVVIRPLSADLRFTYSLFFPANDPDTPLVQEFVSCLRTYLKTNRPMGNE